MPPYLDWSKPVVVVSNFSEAHVDFLSRAEDVAARKSLVCGEQYHGDRTLLWVGDPKLVFVTYPVLHADYICRRFGYRGTSYMAPANPSSWLSLDILREPPLIDRLVAYAGAERTVQLIPYATTPQFLQLAETLRSQYGLNVLLPESPNPGCLWLRDYIDTKAGFRILASSWLSGLVEMLPSGIVCQNMSLAAAVAYWFCSSGQTCIVKADGGENGLGNHIVRPDHFASSQDILQELRLNPFVRDDWLTVERFIDSSEPLSPSLEIFVPPLGAGSPEITYLSKQLFLGFGDFCGVLVSRELLDTKWYPALARGGLLIAARLQEMGYVGHFDLDTIVDDEGQVFLLEINSRRTGGTHVHEFARFLFGPNYLDDVVLLSRESIDSGGITCSDELLETLDDLLYPIQQERRGVVVTVTSALVEGKFGCIIVAPSTEEALALQRALMERIRDAGRRC